MHQLVASPFLADHLILRPGSPRAVKIPPRHHQQLMDAAPGEPAPAWLATAARDAWNLELTGRPLRDVVLVRAPSDYGYARASYELNLGCNYDCEHCYLGLKRFEGLSWPDRERLLHILRDAGVLFLQLTGGEPTIDTRFREVYSLAFELGMILTVSSNGSRLHDPKILELLTTRRPHRLTLSVYGATETAYDGLTRRPGSYKKFRKGLAAAHEAGLPINLNLIVAKPNAHEVDQMIAMAERLGLPHHVYTNMSPTIYGGAESLPAQSVEHLRKRKVFTGCNAGHTFFHVDPHGLVSICKVGRDPQIPLMQEGVEGLRRLGGIADGLLLRQGGCSGCQLSGTCGTCMPLAALYRKAGAHRSTYCQHPDPRDREEVTTA